MTLDETIPIITQVSKVFITTRYLKTNDSSGFILIDDENKLVLTVDETGRTEDFEYDYTLPMLNQQTLKDVHES